MISPHEKAPVDLDTVTALKIALDRAKSGKIAGVAVIEFHGTGYDVTLAGIAETRPTYSLGALDMVKRRLRQVLLGEKGDRIRFTLASKRTA